MKAGKTGRPLRYVPVRPGLMTSPATLWQPPVRPGHEPSRYTSHLLSESPVSSRKRGME